jgi:hypothetical protein
MATPALSMSELKIDILVLLIGNLFLFTRNKGTVSPDFQGPFLAWMDIPTPWEERRWLLKNFRGSSDFTLVLNIKWLIQKGSQINIANQQSGLIPLEIYLRIVEILLKCHWCLINSVLRNIGKYVK